MINKKILPKELLTSASRAFSAGATRLGLDDVNCNFGILIISPFTIVKDTKISEWEVQILIDAKEAFVCFKGESNKIVNKSFSTIKVLVIKSTSNNSDVYLYEDFKNFFSVFDFSVHHGSLIVDDFS